MISDIEFRQLENRVSALEAKMEATDSLDSPKLAETIDARIRAIFDKEGEAIEHRLAAMHDSIGSD